MATVKFIKNHPAGIPEGAIHTVRDTTAQRWIDQGYAEVHQSEPSGSLTDAAQNLVSNEEIPTLPPIEEDPAENTPTEGEEQEVFEPLSEIQEDVVTEPQTSKPKKGGKK